MAKVTKWRHGLKAGNNDLSKPDFHTLDNFKYSESADQLVGIKPITTTLNSFFLGEQHKISSGGENVFFTNNSTKIDWFPPWQGLKDHQFEENHGPEGLVGLTGREYSSDLLTVDFNGELATSESAIGYVSITETPSPISVFGVSFYVAEFLSESNLYYRAYIVDELGKRRAVYEQKLSNVSAQSGDSLIWWFDHPIEAFPTFSFLIELTTDSADGREERLVLVRPATNSKPYIRLMYRTFNDKAISYSNLFITNVEAEEQGKSVEIIREEEPNSPVVSSILTDSSKLKVYVEWDRGGSYQGKASVNGNPVVITSNTENTYYGYSYVTLGLEDNELKFCVDSSMAVINVTKERPPVILDCYLTDTYPAGQVEYKAGDYAELYVEADTPFDKVRLVGGLSNNSLVFIEEGTSAVISFRVTNTTSSLSELSQLVTVSLVATSEVYESSNKLKHNNTYPSIIFNNITYPTGQQALKEQEQALVDFTIQDADTYSIGDPLGQLQINEGLVSRVSGEYNLTSNNYVITATKSSNKAVSTKGTVVFIADQVPTVDIISPEHLRSGGNNSTLPQSHKITLVSNQRTMSPALSASVGTWLGQWVSLATEHYRYLEIHDNDPKGLATFSSLSLTNLAGRVVTAGTGLAYLCQGFISRTLTLPPFGWQTPIGVEPYDTTNLQASWSFKAGITYTDSNIRPQVNRYTIQGGDIRLLDKAATDASSTSSLFTIEET